MTYYNEYGLHACSKCERSIDDHSDNIVDWTTDPPDIVLGECPPCSRSHASLIFPPTIASFGIEKQIWAEVKPQIGINELKPKFRHHPLTPPQGFIYRPTDAMLTVILRCNANADVNEVEVSISVLRGEIEIGTITKSVRRKTFEMDVISLRDTEINPYLVPIESISDLDISFLVTPVTPDTTVIGLNLGVNYERLESL